MFLLRFSFVTIGLLSVVLAGTTTDVKCDRDEFACEDGKKCIPLHEWCDADADCDDESDEKYCAVGWFGGNNKCPLDKFFKCKSGICIPKSGLCDGFDSCRDGSDEADCQTSIATKRPKTTTSSPEDHGLHEYKKGATEYVNKPAYFGPREIEEMRKRAVGWLYQQRDEDNSWGEDTHRAIIALQLSKKDASESVDQLMMKQLELNLAIDIARNSTRPIKQIPLTDLSLYINALLSICKCPNNFHGYNLVQILRDRVDAVNGARIASDRLPRDTRRTSSQGVASYSELYPLVFLTLCINNMTNIYDVHRLQELATNRHPLLDKIDILSMGLMAAKCMMANYSSHQRQEVKPTHDAIKQKLYQKIQAHGFPGNVYEAAILYQALRDDGADAQLTSKAYGTVLNHQNVNGSFGDLLSTYYVLPILSGRSLLSLPESCQQPLHPEDTPLEVLKNMPKQKITVNVELEYGFPVEYTLNLKLIVPSGLNMLDIMRLAEENNPDFSFKLDNHRDSPVIYSIGDIPNDAERGMYWCVYYKRSRSTHADMITLKNAQNLILADFDTLKYWYRPL